MARLRLSMMCRGIVYFALGLAACEFFIVNLTILWVYRSIHNEIAGVIDSDPRKRLTFIDKLLTIPTIKNIVFEGKGGGFLKLIQNTVERVYFVTEEREGGSSKDSVSDVDSRYQLSYMAVDVSSSGEALFLIRRVRARGEAFSRRYTRLIIDIGANDGLLSSNSFNLIQLGWDAILVEPQISLLRLAKQNIDRYADPYNEGRQKVHLVNSLIGEEDGMEDFVLTGEDMESHVFGAQLAEREGTVDLGDQLIVKVPSMTVSTFASKYQVPRHLGILSIDAEGVGDKVLHQWIDGGYRPAYIVYEQLHNKEPMVITARYLKMHGYRFLVKLGWNFIFEHEFEEEEELKN